jgi:hypothetical protein
VYTAGETGGSLTPPLFYKRLAELSRMIPAKRAIRPELRHSAKSFFVCLAEL